MVNVEVSLVLCRDAGIRQRPMLQLEGLQLEGLYKVEGFDRKKGGGREQLTKEKKGFFLVQDIWGRGRGEKGGVFNPAFSICGGWRGPVTDCLLVPDQKKIPDWLIKTVSGRGGICS